MKINRAFVILIVIASLLLIPLIAMQFSSEVNWTSSDFLVMAIMLLSLGFVFEIIMRRIVNTNNRILIGCIVFILFLLLWAELAVGIFGTPLAGS